MGFDSYWWHHLSQTIQWFNLWAERYVQKYLLGASIRNQWWWRSNWLEKGLQNQVLYQYSNLIRRVCQDWPKNRIKGIRQSRSFSPCPLRRCRRISALRNRGARWANYLQVAIFRQIFHAYRLLLPLLLSHNYDHLCKRHLHQQRQS